MILLFCGKKQTGKSSAAKFLSGLSLQKRGYIESFGQDENGDLLIPTEKGMGVLDIYSKDVDAMQWFSMALWPDVITLSFADELKESIHRIFGVDRKHLYGTDEDKSKKTRVSVGSILPFLDEENRAEYENLNEKSYLTARQLMQVFGTDICRKLDNNCWVKSVVRTIKNVKSNLYIIDDCRFENEYTYRRFSEEDVIPILFKDSTKKSTSSHSSETFEFNEEEFELVLDKGKLTLLEKCKKLEEFLLNKGVLSVEV